MRLKLVSNMSLFSVRRVRGMIASYPEMVRGKFDRRRIISGVLNSCSCSIELLKIQSKYPDGAAIDPLSS